MAVTIKWSDEAIKTFEKNIRYLKENWSDREIKNFVKQTEYILSRVENIRKCTRPHKKIEE